MLSRSRKFDYNLVVIGAGSGGLVAAYLASALKAKVALIEKNKMGGDCLHTGCVPSKTLIKTAKVLALQQKAAALGLRSLVAEVHFPDVMARVRRVIRAIEPHDSEERYTALGVSCFQGEARLLSPQEVLVNNRILRTRAVIIASGARPLIPPIEGIDLVQPLTSGSVWGLETLPKRFLVLGGGAIGCELAQAFARLGSEVTLVERNARLLPKEDPEVGESLRDRFERDGIRLLLGTQARRFTMEEGEKILHCDPDGRRIVFDQVLLALGRKPNVEGMGLEEVGVRLRENGTIATNACMRTNVRGVYACGDVTGPFQFTHFASLTGSTAAINAVLFPFRRKANYAVFPWAVYTDPEMARVGINELEASQAGIAYEVTKYELSGLDRALAEEEAVGFVKVLTAPGRDKILGATIVGPSAGELIMEFTLAMQHGLGLNAILATVHPYPTLMDANRLVAGAWKRAHAPAGGLALLKFFHGLRRRLPF